MATFFGIDESNAQGLIDKSMLCIPRKSDGKLDLHAIVSPVRNQDIVFIKQCASQLSLHIKAVGIVQSEYPIKNNQGMCLPVKWVWQGEKVALNYDEIVPLCVEPFYEEHNILVQHEIDELLPVEDQMPQPWQSSSALLPDMADGVSKSQATTIQGE